MSQILVIGPSDTSPIRCLTNGSTEMGNIAIIEFTHEPAEKFIKGLSELPKIDFEKLVLQNCSTTYFSPEPKKTPPPKQFWRGLKKYRKYQR